MSNAIKTVAEAREFIDSACVTKAEELREIYALTGPLGDEDYAEADEAFGEYMERLINAEDPASVEPMSEFHQRVIRSKNAHDELKAMIETYDLDLLVNDSPRMARKLKQLARQGRLVCPAGFHPDQQVFVEVAA